MKTSVLIVIGLLGWGCSNSDRQASAEAEANPETTVAQTVTDEDKATQPTENNSDRENQLRQRVMEIYAHHPQPDMESAFCSEAYMKIYKQVIKLDAEVLDEGEIGFFDYDHWTNSQDGPDNPDYKITDLKLTAPTEAIVTIEDSRSKTGATLKLIRENGNWFVDDILDSEGKSEVSRMKSYLKENGIKL